MTPRVILYYGKDWGADDARLPDAAVGRRRRQRLDSRRRHGRLDADRQRDHRGGSGAKGGLVVTAQGQNFVVDAAYVRSMIGKPGFSIVDARASPSTTARRPAATRFPACTRPGTCRRQSVPFSAVTSESLRLKSPAELAEVFTKAGVGPQRRGDWLLPRRPAGDGDAHRGAFAGSSHPALRRIVPGLVGAPRHTGGDRAPTRKAP